MTFCTPVREVTPPPLQFFCTGRDLKNGTCRCMYSYEKMVYGVQKCDFVHRTPYTTSTGLRLIRSHNRLTTQFCTMTSSS